MKIKEKQLRQIIREGLQSLLMEGPGAGYYVSMDGLKAANVHITGYDQNERGEKMIHFKAQIATSVVEWEAEGYYDAVTSDGIYYDGEMVQEFDDEDRTVQGGLITGYVLENEVKDYYNKEEKLTLKEVIDFINWKLDGFKFKTLVGSGYVHTNLTDPMRFENLEIVSDNSYYGSEAIYIQALELQAPNITNVINWFFENCYKFDEIYGSNGEEGEMMNESFGGGITAQDLEDCYTNDELCDIIEKVLGVNSVETQGDWDQYLYILADKLNERGLSYNDIDAIIQNRAIEPVYENKNGKKIAKLNERQLRRLVRESLKELDWKTYANASKKADQWRQEHPFQYDRNRGMKFDRAAEDALQKKMGIDNKDVANHGGETGTINTNVWHGKPEVSGSRNHDFGDKEGPLGINHNVYHMGKQYGKDGGYGRTRMWDIAHETTPEEFYDDTEMAKKFRDAEKEVEDYNNGNYEYTNDKGWHLKESQLRQIIRESLQEIVGEMGKKTVQPKELTLSELDIANVKIMDVIDGKHHFIAQINPVPEVEWHTEEENGVTDIENGTIEGLVDLSRIQGAIDKRGNVQRRVVEKYLKLAFDLFNITGTVQTLDGTSIVFNGNISLDNDGDIFDEGNDFIIVNKAVFETTGLNSSNSDDDFEEFDSNAFKTKPQIMDDEPIEEPIQGPIQPQIQEPEPVVAEPEVQQEPMDFNTTLQHAGFYLKEEPNKTETMRIYTKDNQWVGTYYIESNSAMVFGDIKDQALIANLKQACDNAGVRYLAQ